MKAIWPKGYRATSAWRVFCMLAADVAGYLCVGPLCLVRRWRGRRFRPDAVHSIAVFRLDGIGDLVLSVSALTALRALFPAAKIVLFVNHWSSGVAALIPGVDEIVELRAPQFAAFKKMTGGAWRFFACELLELRRMGRQRRFDLGIDFRGDFFSILPAFFLNPFFLFSRCSRAGGFLLTNPVRQPEEEKVSEGALNVAFVERIAGRRWEGKANDNALRSPLSRIQKKVRLLLPPGTLDRKYVCLAVAAPYAARCYSPRNWAMVVRLLRRVYSGSFLILGNDGERGRCAAVAELCGSGVHNLAGRMTLAETVACIHGCSLFIGNDGGLVHIASAYRRPLVQLFGPANAVAFGHYGADEHLLQASCPLNPCAESSCPFKEGERCMDRISPEDVAARALPYLNHSCAEEKVADCLR